MFKNLKSVFVVVVLFFSATAWCDSWVGDFSYLSKRGGEPGALCAAAGQGVNNDSVVYTSWDRQRATASNLCFEVYVPGLTDQKEVMPGLLDVFTTAPSKFPARFVSKRGNNYVYLVSMKDFDPILHKVAASGNTMDKFDVRVYVRPINGYLPSAESKWLKLQFEKD